MANLAIIPARGGSKRIPKKNIKIFNGKPILSYAVNTAVRSGLFDEVMVSTDEAEIAETAKQYGASVPFTRSEANSNDHATLSDVLLEVVKNYQAIGKKFDYVCCILSTAALITEQRIKEGYQKITDEAHASLIPVIRFPYPIQRALKQAGGHLKMRETEYLRTRSQDLEAHYYDSGQFYWISTEALLREETLFTEKTGFIELHETEAQDVDTMDDWNMLEIKYDFLIKRTGI